VCCLFTGFALASPLTMDSRASLIETSSPRSEVDADDEGPSAGGSPVAGPEVPRIIATTSNAIYGRVRNLVACGKLNFIACLLQGELIYSPGAFCVLHSCNPGPLLGKGWGCGPGFYVFVDDEYIANLDLVVGGVEALGSDVVDRSLLPVFASGSVVLDRVG